MTQATGSSFFTQAMALATANTISTVLSELLAFMGNRLGQTRANQLLAKVGHLLTLEQQYTLQETYLYGSSRLGVKNQNTTLSTRVASVQNGSLTPIGNAILNTDSVFSGTANAYNLPKAPSSRVFYRTWGLKQYELSNHLGNVQVTISDKKLGVLGSNHVDFIAYEPEVKSATDYYAYGMEMPGKTYQSTAYRYGMNTQEKDNEIYGPGNTLGALYWEYDARIARRWNVDPVVVPSLSNYHAFEGNPIMMVDPLGNSAGWYEGKNGIEFDKNINSQEDLDKSGKGKAGGKYIGKKGVGHDESGNQVSLGEDGIKRPGAYRIKETTVSYDRPSFSETMRNYGPGLNKFAESLESASEFAMYTVAFEAGASELIGNAVGKIIGTIFKRTAPEAAEIVSVTANASGEAATVGINQTSRAILKNGYYEVNGFKFSELYYNKLWSTGRGAPSLVAREVLKGGANTAVPDAIKAGFYRYTHGGWELIYSPSTKEVWHLQPIR